LSFDQTEKHLPMSSQHPAGASAGHDAGDLGQQSTNNRRAIQWLREAFR
jgi:hypothetical protein